MCTITFIPQPDGFLFAMNRDDAFARAQTHSPERHQHGGRIAMYPAEPSGGTWVAVNDAGLALAILNWKRPTGAKLRSRGEVIPVVIAAGAITEADTILRTVRLDGVHPFRLIGASARERRIREWRWDSTLTTDELTWEYRQWFSSGLSDDDASKYRGTICRDALADPDALSLEWVRRLHRSHAPDPGPFSICVHRETGGTLSYTEVIVTGSEVQMNYSSASPCSHTASVTATLTLS